MVVTDGSGAPAICSARPINRISGRVAVQVVWRWSSACDRMELSGDCRACRSCVSSAETSSGSTDMVSDVSSSTDIPVVTAVERGWGRGVRGHCKGAMGEREREREREMEMDCFAGPAVISRRCAPRG